MQFNNSIFKQNVVGVCQTFGAKLKSVWSGTSFLSYHEKETLIVIMFVCHGSVKLFQSWSADMLNIQTGHNAFEREKDYLPWRSDLCTFGYCFVWGKFWPGPASCSSLLSFFVWNRGLCGWDYTTVISLMISQMKYTQLQKWGH